MRRSQMLAVRAGITAGPRALGLVRRCIAGSVLGTLVIAAAAVAPASASAAPIRCTGNADGTELKSPPLGR